MPTTCGRFGPLATACFSSTVLSLVCLFSAGAEWVLVDGNNKGKVYVEAKTITRSGNTVDVWVLDDLKSAHTRGFIHYWSSRAREEHDCANGRFRLLALENYAGNMGTGDIVYKHAGESSWARIPQGTLAQSVWKFVCGKS